MPTKKDTYFDGIILPQHDEGISADINFLKESAKKTVKNSNSVTELNVAEQILVFLQVESPTDSDYEQEINICKNRIVEQNKMQEEAAARAQDQAEKRKKREQEKKARLAETQQRQKEATLRQARRKKLIVVAVCGILALIVAYVIISSVVSTVKDIREEKAKYDPSNVSFMVTGMAPGEFENNSYTTIIHMTVQNGCTLDLAEVRGNLIAKDSQTEEVLWPIRRYSRARRENRFHGQALQRLERATRAFFPRGNYDFSIYLCDLFGWCMERMVRCQTH
mgnify:CR=1 FL=1